MSNRNIIGLAITKTAARACPEAAIAPARPIRTGTRYWPGLWRANFLALLMAAVSSAAGNILFQTGFEASEGYSTNLDLVGQKGWVGVGSGGNGVLSGFFPGKGQQAYVGFAPPASNAPSLFVYPHLNKTVPQAQCLVTMAIIDSSNTNWDDFYWSVYNQQGDELLTLDFDNYELKLYYRLGGTTNRVATGLGFTNGIAYQLALNLDFATNQWSATFDGALVATNQRITAVGSTLKLNLGDFDGAWVVFDPVAPGDNFMVFDDYQVNASLAPPQLKILGLLNGAPTLRLTGLADNNFALDATTNLVNWIPLKTNITTGGSFDYADDSAVGLPVRLYRGRWVP